MSLTQGKQHKEVTLHWLFYFRIISLEVSFPFKYNSYYYTFLFGTFLLLVYVSRVHKYMS